MRVVVNYGGGVNSTALLVEAVNRGERIDAVVFADTGGERPATYAYIERMSAWLVEHNAPPILTVRYFSPTHGAESLEANSLRTGHLPSIAYGYKACSMKWKRDAVEQWARGWLKPGEQAVKWIGYDYGEPRRWLGKPMNDGARWLHRYPLVEWRMDREDCLRAIAAAGLPSPGKSACFFCPMSKPREVVALAKEAPELYARALAMEEAGKPYSGRIRGLGSYFSWREVVEADAAQVKLFERETELPCGCWDGDDDEEQSCTIGGTT